MSAFALAAEPSPYVDATEEAHYHPVARHVWERLMRAHDDRRLTCDPVACAEAALRVADAHPDPLDPFLRDCIRKRNGRPCDDANCNCDIPF